MAKEKPQFPHVNFTVNPEYLEADGLWKPRDDDPPLEGGFQVNIFGSREHYLRLADALREFAEENTADDGEYHQHYEGVLSVDGKVRLHLILRKDDVGDSIYKDFFPRP
jgi:hypothetical protein